MNVKPVAEMLPTHLTWLIAVVWVYNTNRVYKAILSPVLFWTLQEFCLENLFIWSWSIYLILIKSLMYGMYGKQSHHCLSVRRFLSYQSLWYRSDITLIWWPVKLNNGSFSPQLNHAETIDIIMFNILCSLDKPHTFWYTHVIYWPWLCNLINIFTY